MFDCLMTNVLYKVSLFFLLLYSLVRSYKKELQMSWIDIEINIASITIKNDQVIEEIYKMNGYLKFKFINES